MTSTPVKDVGSILTNLATTAGTRTMGIGQTGFQAMLDNQAQRNLGNQSPDRTAVKQPAENKSATENRTAGRPSQTRRKDSLGAKDANRAQAAENTEISGTGAVEELTPKDMEEAMAVLETAAAELVQKTAELLEIPVEEVQSLVEGLGMEDLDMLNPAKLNTLFLQACGVEDSYALLTDEKLYGDYQELMGQLETTLQECGSRLGTDPAQMEALLAKLQGQEAAPLKEMALTEVSQEEGIGENRPEGLGEVSLPGTTGVEEQKDTTESDKKQGQKESSSDHREQGGNLFIQNLKTENFQPEVQQTAESAALAEADTENIMRQIMDYMKVQLKADTSNLEMQLHPASLGTVQVQIASRGGAVTANFIAQNETVKAALESQLVQLIERFDEQGVKVEAIEVTVQTHAFERNLDQGRGREQQNDEPARKGRARRINLNDALSMEDMAEEDALAADMMAANGNTVDYTA